MSGSRSPLAHARGLGAARSGAGHWWAQRVSAVALVPLVLWLVAGLAAHAGADHAAISAWIARPATAIALILLLGAGFWHLRLGLHVVIEDYMPAGFAKHFWLLANMFACAALGVGAVFAVLKIALGA